VRREVRFLPSVLPTAEIGTAQQEIPVIEFTSQPAFNKAAKWWPSDMKVDGLRVWSSCEDQGGRANLNRVGRYGDRYFRSWSQDRVPNYLK
jgi:hypothetical protein